MTGSGVAPARGVALNTSEDRLLGGRVQLRQPAEGYRAAIDPVLLAAATAPPPGARLLDLGCGVGAALFCLLARRHDLTAVGLELQPALAALARENLVLNGCGGRAEIRTGDAAAKPPLLPAGSFDWVMSNPPFAAAGSATAPAQAGRELAHQERSLDLSGWIERAFYFLKPRGGLTMIHRADRLPALLAALDGRAGAVAICPLWPREGVPARRVLLQATKGSRAPARLLPGLVLHGGGAGYSPAAEAILRDGAALDLDD